MLKRYTYNSNLFSPQSFTSFIAQNIHVPLFNWNSLRTSDRYQITWIWLNMSLMIVGMIFLSKCSPNYHAYISTELQQVFLWRTFSFCMHGEDVLILDAVSSLFLEYYAFSFISCWLHFFINSCVFSFLCSNCPVFSPLLII